jgi:diguanylate cyclase (GGDEF)-like protein
VSDTASVIALAAFDIWSVNIPTTMALAVVALIGYVFGQRTRQPDIEKVIEQARREVKRANKIARELEDIASSIRRDLATHNGSVAQFKERVRELSSSGSSASWKDLCLEAEQILAPTLKLASQLSHSYDQIRQQSNQLMTFIETRTDPLTGVCNRRALEESLDQMFAMYRRYEHTFSIIIIDIDNFKKINDTEGHLFGDRALQDVANLLDNSARETDIVARFGGEEFVVVLPHTNLDGAGIYGERFRRRVESDMQLCISGGAATVRDGDTPQYLLARADAALYGAKAAGRNRFFIHNGTDIETVPLPTFTAPTESQTADAELESTADESTPAKSMADESAPVESTA